MNIENLIKQITEQNNYQEIIGQTVFDQKSPGPILHDFNNLINHIQTNEITLSSRTHLFNVSHLPEINALLTFSNIHNVKKPTQKTYPYIQALYILLRASGLTYLDESRITKPVLKPEQSTFAIWKTLSPTEQYFYLLETWLFFGQGSIIGDERDSLPSTFFFTSAVFGLEFLIKQFRNDKLPIKDDKAMESLSLKHGYYNLALLQLFGFITIEQQKPGPGKNWRIKTIQLHEYGLKMIQLLLNIYQILRDQLNDEQIGNLDDFQHAFFMLMKQFVPDWQNTIILQKKQVQGIHIFKVSLGKIWRRIAIADHFNLDDFSTVILNAFKFDEEHLYQFSYKNHQGLTITVNFNTESGSMEPPYTNEVCIGELGLKPNNTMTFLFDFGAECLFDIKLERIEPLGETHHAMPQIIESHGKAPDHDDDDDDDDDY